MTRDPYGRDIAQRLAARAAHERLLGHAEDAALLTSTSADLANGIPLVQIPAQRRRACARILDGPAADDYTAQVVEILDLVGQRFGRLLVLARVPGWRRSRWSCRCDCGATKEVRGVRLHSGEAQSCGCIQRERAAERLRERSTTHGLSGHPLYHRWHAMLRRCYNPRHRDFANYGQRGIRVCAAWLESPAPYIEHIESLPRPAGTTSLDRIDNDGPYQPGNLRWATQSEQNTNQRPQDRDQRGCFTDTRAALAPSADSDITSALGSTTDIATGSASEHQNAPEDARQHEGPDVARSAAPKLAPAKSESSVAG